MAEPITITFMPEHIGVVVAFGGGVYSLAGHDMPPDLTDRDRALAVALLKRALDELSVEGEGS